MGGGEGRGRRLEVWGNRIRLVEVCLRLDGRLWTVAVECLGMNEPAYLVLLQPFSDGEALLSGTTHAIHANALMMKERRNEGTNKRTKKLSPEWNRDGSTRRRWNMRQSLGFKGYPLSSLLCLLYAFRQRLRVLRISHERASQAWRFWVPLRTILG